MNLDENISEINLKKYVYPPSWDKIHGFIKELGVSNHHFEKFYGIPFNIIAQVKLGTKRLPPQYWHYVYEKIIPSIGPGYIKHMQKKHLTKPVTKSITKTITEYPTVATQLATVASEGDNGNHDRIISVK